MKEAFADVALVAVGLQAVAARQAARSRLLTRSVRRCYMIVRPLLRRALALCSADRR